MDEKELTIGDGKNGCCGQRVETMWRDAREGRHG